MFWGYIHDHQNPGELRLQPVNVFTNLPPSGPHPEKAQRSQREDLPPS